MTKFRIAVTLAALMMAAPVHAPPNHPDYDYRWEVLDLSQAAPGYWSVYSNGQRFFHHFHQCTEYGAGCGH
jgi:hypothetical protein